ncbi:MAG: HDOD domain-containing protein [Candidatus Zixiibacteriota bacterium]
MEKIRLLDNIDASKDLLSIPDTLIKVLEAVSSEETSPDQIASIILKDPSLTAKVLKMANSSYYCRNTPIKTVHQGIRVMGANAIKCIALSVSVFTGPRKGANLSEETLRHFYFHCIGVGLLARKMAEQLHHKNPEEAFVAGLLHDLGKLYILNAHPEHYAKVAALEDAGDDILVAERKIFDVDHAELGSVIASRWRLPEDLQRVIRSHHQLQQDNREDVLLSIVKLANILTRNIQAPNLKIIERNALYVSELAGRLGLAREFLDGLAFELLDETITAAVNIGIDIGNQTDLLSRANRELCRSYLMIEGLFKERQELSGKLLAEERLAGMIRSKNIAIATLSHYLNNVATAISGRVQLLQMGLQKGDITDKSGKMPTSLGVIENSILKILAVLAELKAVSRFDDQEFYNDSDAINIDERIKERMDAFDSTMVNS